MKWFKHETNAYMNLKLQAVINKFGLEAYGYYWSCVELVGEQGKNYRVNSEKNWKILFQKLLNIEIKKQDAFLNYFVEVDLIDKKSLKHGDLYIPKLEERCDEYTEKVRRKSGQSPDSVGKEEKRRDKKRIEEIEEIELPIWLNKKAWEEWVKHREEIKKPLTPGAIKLSLKKLEENQKDHVQMIKNSILGRWTGLFPINNNSNKQNTSYQKRVDKEAEERERKENEKTNDKLRILSEQSKSLTDKMSV